MTYMRGIAFDGVDDYVNISPQPTELNGLQNFTVSFWLNQASSVNGVLFSRWAPNARQIQVEEGNTRRVHVHISTDGIETTTLVQSNNNVLTLNAWHHVVVSCSLPTVTIYVDGVNQTDGGTGTPPSTLTSQTNSATRLGLSSDGTQPWQGQMADFALLNVALTQQQVLELYNSRAPRRLSDSSVWNSVFLHYEFLAPSFPTIPDVRAGGGSATAAHDGTSTNSAGPQVLFDTPLIYAMTNSAPATLNLSAFAAEQMVRVFSPPLGSIVLAPFAPVSATRVLSAPLATLSFQAISQANLYISELPRVNQKLRGSPYAIGAWSNPFKRLECGEEASKVRVLLEDKLIARGRWADFWLPVTPKTPGIVACTCVKESAQIAERTCLTCHGTKFAPGFTRFLHQTHFWCSAEAASFTLTNTALDTSTKKAHVISLAPNALTGTITTSAKSFSNPRLVDWELKLDAFRRVAGNVLRLRFTLNDGATWSPWQTISTKYVAPISTAPPMNYGYVASIPGALLGTSGSIRFQVEMSRSALSDLTPQFEILRLRRIREESHNYRLYDDRPDGQPGQILVLRPQIQEQDSLDSARGRLIEHLGDRAWTAPLDLFDLGIPRDTPEALVEEYLGPHPFYHFSSGVQSNTLYVITKRTFNDGMGMLTQQWFDDRRAQDGEPYWLVW